MKLRCIGGPKDGQWEDISNEYKYGDQVRFHLPQKFTLLNSENIAELYKHSQDAMQITYTFYIIDKIGWHDKETHHKMFLRFIEWSTWQCIEHQFDYADEKKEAVIKAAMDFYLYGNNEDLAKLMKAIYTFKHGD